MNRNKVNSKIAEYDLALLELAEQFEDINSKKYEAYIPFYKEINQKYIYDFCRGQKSAGDATRLKKQFENILNMVCQQDAYVAGVYFRRCIDDKRYLYIKGDDMMREVSFDLNNKYVVSNLYTTLVGAELIEYGNDKRNINIFGFQSRLLSASEQKGEADYQITLLYDTKYMDAILEKYKLDSEIYFGAITENGVVLYDSQGKQEGNSVPSYATIDRIVGNEETFLENGITYRINRSRVIRGQAYVFYIVPENAVNRFSFGNTERIIVLAGVSVLALFVMLVFYIKKMIDKGFLELEKAISQVGRHNLKYRIPVSAEDNEFSRIACVFNKMCDDLQTAIDRNYVYQILQQKSEYKALKTSVNPHFLYNSLQMIRQISEENGQNVVADTVLMLSRIFDYQIHGECVVTFWFELDALQNYIDFLSIRYHQAFDCVIDFDDRILDYLVPKQVFIPIMENYFEHAFRGDGMDFIHIIGYLDEDEDMIHIDFCDNGKGISEDRLAEVNMMLKGSEMDDEKNNECVGFKNILKRMQIFFEGNCRVELVSNEPEPGVCVSLVCRKICDLKQVNAEMTLEGRPKSVMNKL